MKKNLLGSKAEILAGKFLKKKNFEIIEKNFWIKRFGEIDIIAKKDNIYYFVEVKALKENVDYHPSLHYTDKKKEKFHSLVNFYVNKNRIENFITLLITIIFGKKIKIKIFKNV